MRFLIVSDAWHPQVNGVVRTIEATALALERLGHVARVIGPDVSRRTTFSAPSYPSIKLEFFARARLRREMDAFRPDAVHLATEGPLGWSARALCLAQGRSFTTAYHTRFPEYLAARAPRSAACSVLGATYAALRLFHAPAHAVMVATQSIARDLSTRKFKRIAQWSRGVDTAVFRPYQGQVAAYEGLRRPVLLCVGRVAVEKNLRAFLSLNTVGSKVVIGDGPDLAMLRKDYPDAHFLGAMEGEALGRHYAAADVFVFPSLTDTFGLVLLEACAAGLRVACLPAPGPVDLFSAPETAAFAALDHDLGRAVARALALPENAAGARKFAEGYSWEACTRQFLEAHQIASI
ncbi:MAG: glycosyltransferase family 1 protein [Bdellovibrionales bacterium]